MPDPRRTVGAGHDAERTSGSQEGNVLSKSDVLPEYRRDPRFLREWARDRAAVELVSRYLGANVPLGRNFACPLPHHTGPASFYEDPRTHMWKLRCWCTDEDLFLTIAELWASRAHGEVRRITGPRPKRDETAERPQGNAEAAVWYLRAAHDVGLIAPLSIDLPELRHATRAERVVMEGLRLLIGLRWLVYPGQPVTFARDFAPAWCAGSGLNAMQGYRALAALERHGVIRSVPARGRAKQWLPGDLP